MCKVDATPFVGLPVVVSCWVSWYVSLCLEGLLMPVVPLLEAAGGGTSPRALWLLAEGQFPHGPQAQFVTQWSLNLP